MSYYAVRKGNLTSACCIIYEGISSETEEAFLRGIQNEISIITLHNHIIWYMHTCKCSPSSPTHNEPLYHLGLNPPLRRPPLLIPPLPLLPSHPHAYWAHPRCLLCLFSHSTHPRPHTLGPSEQRWTFFLLSSFSSRLPPTPKCCESLADTLKHQHSSCVCVFFKMEKRLTSLFSSLWFVKHSLLLWGLSCT